MIFFKHQLGPSGDVRNVETLISARAEGSFLNLSARQLSRVEAQYDPGQLSVAVCSYPDRRLLKLRRSLASIATFRLLIVLVDP